MTSGTAINDTRWKRFEHPVAFWSGAAACVAGVVLHLPMYCSTRTMGYRMAGMRPDAGMLAGMALIVVGLVAALYGRAAGLHHFSCRRLTGYPAEGGRSRLWV